jgi:predicted TIM-barrel fold metal-dependent hydrolase
VIVDLSAFCGHWPTHPLAGDLDRVWASLEAYGVDRAFVSPLEAAWCRNPHAFNNTLYRETASRPQIWPVPVLDPTIATWEEEAARAADQARVRVVRLLPTYSPYGLADADDLLQALAEAGLAVIVQTRLEDPRRQHSLAQVSDLPAAEVADAADRHAGLTVIIGGPRTAETMALRERLTGTPNLYADVSQADGMDALKVMVDEGLGEKLVFGSHVPLFTARSAFARVVTDLDDEAAAAILGGNAGRILRLGET